MRQPQPFAPTLDHDGAVARWDLDLEIEHQAVCLLYAIRLFSPPVPAGRRCARRASAGCLLRAVHDTYTAAAAHVGVDPGHAGFVQCDGADRAVLLADTAAVAVIPVRYLRDVVRLQHERQVPRL